MSYSNISDHHSMVFDAHRNQAYVRALQKLVNPESSVMDLGAGVGVLGLTAAGLGAKNVLLVEPARAVEAAREVARQNNFGEVVCFPCRVEELDYTGEVDIILSVFTGNFLLSEDLLPSLFFARDKYLAPGGSLIPDCARMEVVPVFAPQYYHKNVDVWRDSPVPREQQSNLHIDFSCLRKYAANTLYYDTAENFSAKPLAQAAILMELNFNTATSAACDASVEFEASQSGVCHGWLGWFQMRLADEWLSTGIDAQALHWRQVFLPLETPVELQVGEKLCFALKRPEFGEWTWTTSHNGQVQRQSTFMSQPLTPQMLQKQSAHNQPKLNERGRAAHWLLGQMQGCVQVKNLADKLQQQFPGLFYSHGEAVKFVKSLVHNFS